MTQLTKAALRAAEMLRSFGGSTGNPLDALLSFLQPLLEDRDGHRFEAREFADAVRDAYGWNFTEDVAGGFRSALRTRGWLKPILQPNGMPRFDDGKPLFVVSCRSDGGPALEQPIEDVIERITLAFRNFLLGHEMPVEGVYRDDDDIIAQVVTHLLDNFGQTNRSADGFEPGAGDESDDGTDTVEYGDQRSYQIGRFVSEAQLESNPLSADLNRIAAVGLLAELAQDFSKPTSRVSKSNVAIYLDSPVAHDLLGASGRQAAEQTRSVIKKLQEMGASINIFEQSMKEMQVALRTILGKSPANRFGAIQDAFLRGELDEAFVYTIATDPARALQGWGVKVKSSSVQNTLKPDQYFTGEHFRLFFDRLVTAHGLDQRAEVRSRHDANAVAFIMRLRKGHETDDLFQSNHLFLTRNRAFASLARNFCINEGLISSESVGPFVTMYDLAASVWLRTGLYERSMEIPRTRLLAGCERVLALRRPVVRTAQRAILKLRQRPELDEEQLRQVEAILSQDRSRMLISDRVRGAMKDVDDGDLLDIYRRVLADEEMKGYQKGRIEVAEDRDRILHEKETVEATLAQVSDAALQRETTLGAQLGELRDRLDANQLAESERLNTLLCDVNRATRRLRVAIVITLLVVALLIFAASFWKEFFAAFDEGPKAVHKGFTGHLFFFLCGLAPAVVLIADQVSRLMGWERPTDRYLVEPWAKRRFLRQAKDRGLSGLIGANPEDHISFAGTKLVLRNADSADERSAEAVD